MLEIDDVGIDYNLIIMPMGRQAPFIIGGRDITF